VNEPPPRFSPLLQPPNTAARAVAWFGFRGDRLLVRLEQESAHLPEWDTLAALGAAEDASHYLGRLGDVDCYAVELGEQAEPGEGLGLEGLRALFGRLADPHFSVAGRASQILEWDRTHRFCGRCGEPTVRAAAERAKQCPRCGLLSFPRLSPAVIMRVERDDQILLGRNRGFITGVYSVLAGFVESGESLEEAVAREVAEEAGIQVTDIRYFGSQSWPFPHQMMIGFVARHAGGEIQIDPQELEDAQWFSRDNLPRLPSKMSISRRLIDDWLNRGRR
jgi:NAD+ diphosphatase